MTTKINYFDSLVENGEFRFLRLVLPEIDNEPVLKINRTDMIEQETCLFHKGVAEGVEYLSRLENRVRNSLDRREPLAIVRFADGEYAFYHRSLECNGLYRQAESLAAIDRALPFHIAAMKELAQNGLMAPLVFPGNLGKRVWWQSLLSFKNRPSAATFLDFLRVHDIEITGDNYLPFYLVYAYLTSAAFAKLADGKKICLVNSDFYPEAWRRWFSRFLSVPEIVFTEIPAEYVATRWDGMRDDVLERVPSDADLCLVGAGAGALPLCVDLARHLSIPVFDAGHVLNMMNGREDKSNGPRLYTIRN